MRIKITKVDFDCILNDTTKKLYVEMINCSILDVIYEWNFIQEVDIGEEASETAKSNNQLFSILSVNDKLSSLTTQPQAKSTQL